MSAATCALTGRMFAGRAGALALALGVASGANALEILIVNTGAYSGTDTALQARQTVAGNTSTLMGVGSLPTDLSAYDQIWDMGYSVGLGSGYVSSLTNYLQGGGTLFLMGENPGAAPLRNPAISNFMTGLGGGTVAVSGYGASTQTLGSQFQVNNSTASVSFAGSGKFGSVGTGTCITSDCTAAAWGAGTLANATSGAVISVLDINFLTSGYLAPDFTDNLIAYLQQQQEIGSGGGTPPPSVSDIDNGASAYDASGLGSQVNPAFKGGTLNIDAPSMTLAQNFTVGSAGGTLQATGTAATLSGTITDEVAGTPGSLAITGAGGSVTLTSTNTYTGTTTVGSGSTLALSGSGSVASSSGVVSNGSFDISGTTSGTAITSLSGTGTVALGGQTLTLTSASGTFTGAIGGTGGVAVAGGTQTLSGTNTYTGATQVASGATLALGGTGNLATSSGVANSGTFDISGTTAGASVSTLTGAGNVVLGGRTLTLGTASTGFTGSFSGTGGLAINGGTLALTGTQAYSGLTTVGNSAVLSLNSVSAGGVSVLAGGRLSGAGSIAGPVSVASGATLSPGNSPGVMTVGSTVTLAAGSTFEAEINGPTAGTGAGFHDQLNVVGGASQFHANGATLVANLTTISGLGTYTPYVPSLGQTFRIVTAEGGVGSTRFAPLAQPDGLAAGTRLRVLYNTNSSNAIDLRVVPTSFAVYGAGRGLNRNAISAATAVDRLVDADDIGSATTAQSQLANTVLGLTAAQIDGALLGLAGEIHGAIAAAQPLSGQGLQNTVAKHLALSGNVASDKTTGWADYSTGDARWSADGVSSAARASRNQLTLGVDVLQTSSSRVGFAASLTTTQVGSSSGGSGKLEDNIGVIYGQHTLGGWVADAQVGYGSGHSRSRRADPLAAQDTAVYSQTALTTDLRTRQSFAGAGLRLPLQLASVALEPFARIGTQQVKRDAGTESSSSPSALSLGALSATGTRVSTGVALTSTEKNPMVSRHTYRGTLAVGHDSGSLLRPVVSATLGGMATTIEAPQAGRSFVQANVFGTWLLTPGAYAYAGISGEARSQRVEKAVMVGAAVTF